MQYIPQSKVRTGLVECQIAIAHMQHIRIVVAVEVAVLCDERVHVQDLRDSPPIRRDVVGRPPRVACLVAPEPHLIRAPLAQRIQDRTILSKESFAHDAEAECSIRGRIVDTVHRPIHIAKCTLGRDVPSRLDGSPQIGQSCRLIWCCDARSVVEYGAVVPESWVWYTRVAGVTVVVGDKAVVVLLERCQLGLMSHTRAHTYQVIDAPSSPGRSIDCLVP